MRPSIPVLFVALSSLAFAPAQERIAFHVAPGTKVTKTFEQKLHVSLDEMRLEHDGEEVPHEDLGNFDMQVDMTSKIVLTDHYREMEEAQPKVLARTFDVLTGSKKESMSAEGEDQDDTRDESSELEGKTVVFTRSAEGERFERKFEGEGGEASLLEGLTEDTDLRAFVPGRAVAEGDSWSVEAKEFAAIFDPGGDVALKADEDDEEGQKISAKLSQNFEGKIAATFKGFREEGAARVAVIALECKLTTQAEGDSDEDDMSVHQRFAVALDLEGEILWSLAGGHAQSLALTGPVKITMAKEMSGEYDGETLQFSQTFVLSGTGDYRGAWKNAE